MRFWLFPDARAFPTLRRQVGGSAPYLDRPLGASRRTRLCQLNFDKCGGFIASPHTRNKDDYGFLLGEYPIRVNSYWYVVNFFSTLNLLFPFMRLSCSHLSGRAIEMSPTPRATCLGLNVISLVIAFKCCTSRQKSRTAQYSLHLVLRLL